MKTIITAQETDSFFPEYVTDTWREIEIVFADSINNYDGTKVVFMSVNETKGLLICKDELRKVLRMLDIEH